MPRNRFYNRRSRHEHSCKHHLWRPFIERCGKPAGARFLDRSRDAVFSNRDVSTAAPDHLAVIRPPTAARLTARRRLRVDRLPPSRGARGGESAAACSAVGSSADSNPLTPFAAAENRVADAALFPVA